MAGYKNQKQIEYQQRKRDSTNEIGPPAPPPDPERYASCRNDLHLFLVTYLRHLFYRPFSDDQLHTIGIIQECCLSGGTFAEAMPRGTGKTTIVIGAMLWATLYGHRRYVIIVGSDKEAASGIMKNVKTELEINDVLLEDFAYVISYIRAIDGKAQRCVGQTSMGERTRIEYSAQKIVFPTIQGSPCSGCVLEAAGITSGIRGRSHNNGTTIVRPDLVICDDPQTKGSAKSATQTREREEIILGDLLGLAGHDKSIAAIMPCTVIQKGDLSDRFLSHESHPEWRGHRSKLVYEWGENKELWDEYHKIWREERLNLEDGERSMSFYRDNRAKMDEGARVADEGMYDADCELSAIQHAYNLLYKVGEVAFMSEYQNDPEAENKQIYEITITAVAKSFNTMQRGMVNTSHSVVTAGADINRIGINWVVASFDQSMTAHVIDYGKYPERGDLWPVNSNELDKRIAIAKGLNQVRLILEAKSYKVDVALYDRGYEPEAVHRFIENTAAQFRQIASRGYAAHKYNIRESDLIGAPMEQCHAVKSRFGPMISHSADYWREIVQRAFLATAGEPGSCSLWGNTKTIHFEFAEEICREKLLQKYMTDRGLRWEWHTQAGGHDKLDALVMAYVAAAMMGIRSDGLMTKTVRKKQVNRRPQRNVRVR